MEIVVDRALVRRVLVPADVDAEHARKLRALDIRDERIDAAVVEAEPVDDGLALRNAEHARLRIARLRAWRRRADFDEAEAERRERIDVRAVLVESRGETDRVLEAQTERIDRQRLRSRREQRIQTRAIRGLDRDESEIVRALGV